MTGPTELPDAGVAPAEAIAFFRAKGFRIGFSWEDVWRGEHARWFTVAKAMSRDLLEDIRAAVDAAIADGTTLEQFKKDLRPKLEARGWWGRKRMIDPLTGAARTVQLGSPRRLRIIFNTNVRTAYAAGKWQRIQRVKAAFPYLEYSSVMDGREREEHHNWHGTILPVDHPWWDTHYPPCDWECRCDAIPRTKRMLARDGKAVDSGPPEPNPSYTWTNSRTGETGELERGIGKGWDYNVGNEYLRGLAPGPMPDGFDGEEVGAAAQLTAKGFTGAQAALVDRFLAAFGIDAGAEASWRDRDGWPLSIGRGWFIAQGGGVRVPANGVIVDRIAAAIVTPDSIRWVWIAGVDGRALLMRRYVRAVAGVAMIVEIGGAGWRWRIGRADDAAPDELTAAGYDPRQARDARGRWSSGGGIGSAVAAMWASEAHSERSLGTVDADEGERIKKATGLDVTGYERVIATSGARHAKLNHGDPAVEAARGQFAVTPTDFAKIPAIVTSGAVKLVGEPDSRKPMRLVHRAKIGDRVHDYRESVGRSRKRLTLESLRIEGG